MPVKTEKELSETQRGHWLKVVAAIELRKAMNLLGLCYRELGMPDMKQLEEAAKEILSMDAMKKQIVYSLGLVTSRWATARNRSVA